MKPLLLLRILSSISFLSAVLLFLVRQLFVLVRLHTCVLTKRESGPRVSWWLISPSAVYTVVVVLNLQIHTSEL